MVYISGPNEKLEDLLKEAGCSFADFAKLNPELCAKYPHCRTQLPAFSPLFLKQPFDPDTRAEVANTLLQFDQKVRCKLNQMQESGVDFPTQVALKSMMEELQDYAKWFRKGLNNPLINTPWTGFNKCMTNKSHFKLVGETLKYGSEQIRCTARFVTLDRLYEDMLARDILNRDLYMLQNKASRAEIRNLEQQIKILTARIKEQLPKKLTTKLSQYVSEKFTFDGMKKMRSDYHSASAARTGKHLTTNLDVLNKSGLAELKKITDGLKTLGNRVNKVGTMVSYGAVAYDTHEAMKTSGAKDAAKTFITGVGTIYLTSQAVSAVGGTTALGGFVVGYIAGETVVASALISTPIGWVIAVLTGIATANLISYETHGILEKVWDLSEWGASRIVSEFDEISNKIDEVANKLHNQCIEAAHFTHQVIEEMWSNQPQWVLDFYNGKTSE